MFCLTNWSNDFRCENDMDAQKLFHEKVQSSCFFKKMLTNICLYSIKIDVWLLMTSGRREIHYCQKRA